MIITEILEDGRSHTYSSEGYKILQVDTGVVYEDAIDVVAHEYAETDEQIEANMEEASAENYIAALTEFGRSYEES